MNKVLLGIMLGLVVLAVGVSAHGYESDSESFDIGPYSMPMMGWNDDSDVFSPTRASSHCW